MQPFRRTSSSVKSNKVLASVLICVHNLLIHRVGELGSGVRRFWDRAHITLCVFLKKRPAWSIAVAFECVCSDVFRYFRRVFVWTIGLQPNNSYCVKADADAHTPTHIRSVCHYAQYAVSWEDEKSRMPLIHTALLSDTYSPFRGVSSVQTL